MTDTTPQESLAALAKGLWWLVLIRGILAIVWALLHGALKESLYRVYTFFLAFATPGMKTREAIAKSSAPPFAYGIAIAVGTLTALFFPDLFPLPF